MSIDCSRYDNEHRKCLCNGKHLHKQSDRNVISHPVQTTLCPSLALWCCSTTVISAGTLVGTATLRLDRSRAQLYAFAVVKPRVSMPSVSFFFRSQCSTGEDLVATDDSQHAEPSKFIFPKSSE